MFLMNPLVIIQNINTGEPIVTPEEPTPTEEELMIFKSSEIFFSGESYQKVVTSDSKNRVAIIYNFGSNEVTLGFIENTPAIELKAKEYYVSPVGYTGDIWMAAPTFNELAVSVFGVE